MTSVSDPPGQSAVVGLRLIRCAAIPSVSVALIVGCATFEPSRIQRSQQFDTPVRVGKGDTLYQFRRTSAVLFIPLALRSVYGGTIREVVFNGVENGQLTLTYRDIEVDTRRPPFFEKTIAEYRDGMRVTVCGATLHVLFADSEQLEAVIETGFTDEAFIEAESELCLQRVADPALPEACDDVLLQSSDRFGPPPGEETSQEPVKAFTCEE